MKLTAEQEEEIRKFVNGQKIGIQTLSEDIIDHLCCVVEAGLGKGRSFEELFDKAVTDLAPDGLKELEHKTLYLLNSNRIIQMKKLLYLTGFLGAFALTAGQTFVLLHWPGATEAFIVGFLLLFLIFIPLLAIDRYKVAVSKALSERIKIILGVIAAVLTGLAGVFKYLHLQGAEILLISGAIAFAFGFLPFLFFTMYKKSVS